MLSSLIDAYQMRDVVMISIKGAFLQAKVPENMKLWWRWVVKWQNCCVSWIQATFLVSLPYPSDFKSPESDWSSQFEIWGRNNHNNLDNRFADMRVLDGFFCSLLFTQFNHYQPRWSMAKVWYPWIIIEVFIDIWGGLHVGRLWYKKRTKH